MRRMLITPLIPAALIATTVVAGADPPRSSVYQPDFSSCSASRQACLNGTSRRGERSAGCETAYTQCMRSGTWDTYGLYGRRVTVIARQ